MNVVTCIAPVNIAVIKYWGKRNESLILPLNDSLSATLCSDQMHAKTTVMASPKFKENKIWLNGKEESFENPRLQNCLKQLQNRAQHDQISSDILSWKIHICSENNFPTAAGLASSAAGYACLVYTLAQLYAIKSDISGIARYGSGSACRSTLGGWVRWHRGNSNNGDDSLAEQIVSNEHWNDMHILILVVNDTKKKTSSTVGMKNSVETSELLKYRVDKVVPQRMKNIIKAINECDFETFAKITMQDSNQFHAICLDTYPPCIYMNDVSHQIVDFVHLYNEISGSIKIAYTFDAGPNACLFMLKSEISEFVSALNMIFPPVENTVEYIKGITVEPVSVKEEMKKKLIMDPVPEGSIKYLIHTKIGQGPKVLNDQNEHLLTEAGFPKNIKTN